MAKRNEDTNTMNRRTAPLMAAALIALGAIGDHLVNLNTKTASPAAAQTATNTSPSNVAVANPPITSSVSTSALDAATESAYATASRSVVYVVSEGVGSGSGVIYNTNGDIVTNNHVVEGATKLSATLNNGKTYAATLVGTDKADDLAVIHISASGLTPAHYATAGSYHVAQTVLAIGSPLGLKQSVTSGLISGLNRVEQEPSGAYLPNSIQTSAPINPGNSGGALVTLDGTVVGIPTLEQTGDQNGTTAQSIGFAIPSGRVVSVANQIIANGKVTHTGRAYLGVAPTDAKNATSSPFGGFGGGQTAPTTSGALIEQVAGNGPAGKAGVEQGDVITKIGDTTVTDAQDLLSYLATKKPGDTVSITINRNGNTQSLSIRLGELPA